MEPIKIILTAESDAAVKNLRDFMLSTGNGLKQVSIGAKEAAEGFNNSRMAMMELGHVGRSMVEGLAAGISPLRMMAMELPRVAQAASMSGIGLNTIKTALLGLSPLTYGIAGGLALAAGAAALIWHEMNAQEEEAIANHNEMVKSLQAMPGVISHINDAAKAGLLSPETSKKLLENIGAVERTFDKIDLLKPLIALPTQNYATNALPPAAGTPAAKMPAMFGLPGKDDIKSVNEELVRAGFLLKEIGKNGEATYSTSDKGQALLQIINLRQKLAIESVSGYEKERLAAKQSYDSQLADLNDYIERANTALKPGEGDQLRAQLAADYNRQISEINFKQQEEDRKKASAAFAEGQKLFAQTVREENAKLEADLEASAARQGKNREQIYEEEFTRRIDLLTRELYAGEIDEQQYTAAMLEATTKRLKAINTEREATQKLKDEKARLIKNQSQGQIENLLSNPYTSSADKAAGLAPYLQSARADTEKAAAGYGAATTDQQRLEILNQVIEGTARYNALLQKQRQLLSQTSFKDQFAGAVAHLKEMNNLAKESAQAFENVANTAIQSVSQGIMGLIEGTKSWKQALQEVGNAILNEIITAIVTMAVRWVITSVMMAAFGEALIASTAALYSAAWAGPAILATIASYGAAAAAAPPEVMGALAFAPGISALATAAREHGGPVEAGMSYIVGERGQELFIPNSNGRIVNANDTSRALTEKRDSGQCTNIKTQIHFWDDPRRMEKHIRDNPEIHHTIIDVMKRGAHHLRPPN